MRSLSGYVYGLKCSFEKILLCGAACINNWHIPTAIDKAWWLIYGSLKLWMNVGFKSLFWKLFGWTAARKYANSLFSYLQASHTFCLSVTSVHLTMKLCWCLFPGKHWVAFIFGLLWLLWSGTGHSRVVKSSDRKSRWCLRLFYLKDRVPNQLFLKHKRCRLLSDIRGMPNLHTCTRPILLL